MVYNGIAFEIAQGFLLRQAQSGEQGRAVGAEHHAFAGTCRLPKLMST
jgi:hypothetical protein